ncbi:MAG: hypothetical protein PHU14_12010 [Methylovulum sp.]|nr:hypothetical protein [Methylovulum sp.]
MRTIKAYSMVACMAGVLASCSNALYFYETDKIALNTEARPDASQPIQGSLGLKQRVVLVAPKKAGPTGSSRIAPANVVPATPAQASSDKNKSNAVDPNDAVSSISNFSFGITPDHSNYFFNPVLIQTAFITGEAAANLGKPEAIAAAKAIAQDSGNDIGAEVSIMKNVAAVLKERNTPEAIEHLSALDGLAKAVMPAKYPVTVFGESGSNAIITANDKGTAINPAPDNIGSALTYWDQLNKSAKLLKRALPNLGRYKLGGVPITDNLVKIALQDEYERTGQELTKIGQTFAGSPAYTAAIQYYIDN